METNEALKTSLSQGVEEEERKLVERLQELPEGDLKTAEWQVLERVMSLGRKWLGSVPASP
jgi:hypothetical protein